MDLLCQLQLESFFCGYMKVNKYKGTFHLDSVCFSFGYGYYLIALNALFSVIISRYECGNTFTCYAEYCKQSKHENHSNLKQLDL